MKQDWLYSGYGYVHIAEGYSFRHQHLSAAHVSLWCGHKAQTHSGVPATRILPLSKPLEKPQLFQIVSAGEKPSF